MFAKGRYLCGDLRTVKECCEGGCNMAALRCYFLIQMLLTWG